MTTTYAASLADIREAAEILRGHAHRTPVQTCSALNERAGRELYFKCEHLQKIGAFKFRGAFHAIRRLSEAERARGVVTHSSGNHAQALALAAKLHGIPAHVIMPSNASAPKKAGVIEYGANVIECEPTLEARETTAARVQEETGAAFIPPFDHPHIIAGQGTAALELLEDVPDLDAVIAPVGGGGLLSGTCLAAHGIRSDLRVFAAEPLGADDAARSMAAGEMIPQTSPNTVADGLLTSLGELTWPIIRDHCEAVITVGEEEIVKAMRVSWERGKLLIEPSAAVTVAAVLSDQFRSLSGLRKVGVILSGGNLDLDRIPWAV